jgi:hypothetical protein
MLLQSDYHKLFVLSCSTKVPNLIWKILLSKTSLLFLMIDEVIKGSAEQTKSKGKLVITLAIAPLNLKLN